MFISLALMLAQTATNVAPPALSAATAAKANSLQAAFDSATAAYTAKQWKEAIKLFDALEARLKGKGTPKVLATIELRRGLALKWAGEWERATKSLRPALSAIPVDDADLRGERLDGVYALANILLSRSDFSDAEQIVNAARSGANTPSDQLNLTLLALRSTMFEPGNRAAAYAEEAQRLVSMIPEKDKRMLASVDTLRARLLLNRSQHEAAYDLLKKALARQGGLDMKVDLNEVATRSDLAIAALLNNDNDRAREYLAYTGAGRISQSPFGRASAMAPPSCGGDAALKPEDNAIVEFGIDGVGAVSYAQTVYMSRPSSAGAKAFADAVMEWSWEPSTLAKIPAFYKALTRIELRCSNAVARPSLSAALDDARGLFLKENLRAIPFGFDAASLPTMRAELARREGAGNDPIVPALMIAISMNAGSSSIEALKMIERAEQLLPPDAPVALKASVASDLISARAGSKPTSINAQRDALRALLLRPDFAADPATAGTLRLSIAQARYQKPPPPDAIELVTAVADDARLDKDNPLKTAALLRLATLQSQARQIDAASATFARTGLTADQCALLDTPPALAKSNVDSGDFPMEAQRWGFEGWVRLEHDILANGRTAETRAVVAYPPFVFRDAAVKVAAAMRFQPTFRPGSTKGCMANQSSLNFRIAD
jgi:tetratricopeptide (TPR) repeat protein